MKSIRFIVLSVFVFIGSVTAINAQKRFPTTEGVTSSQFNGAFYIQFDKNQANNFFAVDMTQFTDVAAAKYFQQSVFKDHKLVSVSVPQNGIWYLSASSVYTLTEISDRFTQLKEEAVKFASGLSESGRKTFLEENNKK